MKDVHTWAVELAHEAAPDEAPLAPLMIDAYLAGGQARRDLFRTDSGMAGGFTSDAVLAVMPKLFNGLVASAGMMGLIVGSEGLGKLLGCLKNALDLVLLRDKSKQLQRQSGELKIDAQPDASPPLRQVADTIYRELRTSGLENERCEIICYRVLMKLLQEPEAAQPFVKQLEEAAKKP